jgi:hypothetical protein
MQKTNPNNSFVFFLGRDENLAEKLSNAYQLIVWDPSYRLNPKFSKVDPDRWPEFLPRKVPILIYIEMVPEEMGLATVLIQAIRAFNSKAQVVLVAEDDVDYFLVAKETQVGNVIKKSRFDQAMIRALTVRLLTGNIFGFEPYFPNGYTVGPMYRIYTGNVSVTQMIEETCAFGDPYVHQEEKGNFRMFLHELLLNTFAYAITGITPEDRDTQALRAPPEVFIPERRGIKVTFVADKEKIGFSVQDSTGNFSMLRMLEKLRRQSRIAGETIPPGVYDETGRGISLIYRYSRLIVNILRGVRTETIFLQYHEEELNRFESIIITEVAPISG